MHMLQLLMLPNIKDEDEVVEGLSGVAVVPDKVFLDNAIPPDDSRSSYTVLRWIYLVKLLMLPWMMLFLQIIADRQIHCCGWSIWCSW